MGINVEPTLICDRCQQPIEKGKKVIELSASTFDGIENPAFAAAYINTTDEDYYFFFHPACILDAIDTEVEAAVSDTSDAAEPVECDSLEPFHQCCRDLTCTFCHAPVEDLRGTPGRQVYGVDRAQWDAYGRTFVCGL